MRSIHKSSLGKNLTALLDEDNPISEDIEILDENGMLVAAVITRKAYSFFLKKIEEAEDEIDNKTSNDFYISGEKGND